MIARFIFPMTLLVLCVGCSDYHLATAPEEPEDRVALSAGKSGDVVEPTSFGLPEIPSGEAGGPESPWNSFDPGSVPDVFFAVAWNDPRTACDDCFMPQYAGPRYDVIDATGRVVLSFDSPDSSLWSSHGTIQPFGPGRFLATTHVSDSEDPEFPWKAWVGDATTGETELVLEWGWHNIVRMPVAGEKVVLPELYGQLIVLADPGNPDRVFLLTDNTMMYAQPLLGALTSVDLRDPEGEVFTWQPEEMVDEAYLPEWGEAPWAPWLVRTIRDDERTVLVLGIEAMTGDDGLLETILVGFDPASGPLDWALNVTDMASVDTWSSNADMLVQPPSNDAPGRALFHRGTDSWCPSPTFGTWDGQTLTEFEGSDELFCSRLGPQLDEEGETFLYYGAVEDSGWAPEHRLVVSHQGADVWALSQFQQGLAASPFDIHGLVLLEPVEAF